MNNADSFSQPSLIIFIKGADIFDHDCRFVNAQSFRLIYSKLYLILANVIDY